MNYDVHGWKDLGRAWKAAAGGCRYPDVLAHGSDIRSDEPGVERTDGLSNPASQSALATVCMHALVRGTVSRRAFYEVEEPAQDVQ